MGRIKNLDRMRKLVGQRAAFCPFMEAVIWGAPSLRDDLEAAGIALVEQHSARVALVRVEQVGDLAAIRRLRAQQAALPIVVMVGTGDAAAALALAAVELGALGLVGDDAAVTDIATALFEVAAGRAFIASTGAQLLLDAVRRRGVERDGVVLTPREREVLVELVTGRTTADIAKQLNVSVATAQTHLKSLFRKLDVTSRAAATAVALRLRLV
jgi:DNA-binding NarL/FixJ family response regulator